MVEYLIYPMITFRLNTTIHREDQQDERKARVDSRIESLTQAYERLQMDTDEQENSERSCMVRVGRGRALGKRHRIDIIFIRQRYSQISYEQVIKQWRDLGDCIIDRFAYNAKHS